MFNAFHHYGDVMEVVIPAKRDKGGKRFGFARFDRVDNPREFEYTLDKIIIWRDKISVNISRFRRPDGNISISTQGVNFNSHPDSSTGQKQFHHVRMIEGNNYAQAVRSGSAARQDGGPKRALVTYEAAKEDMSRFKKAFIGVVVNSGMTYNIQNAFHAQGEIRPWNSKDVDIDRVAWLRIFGIPPNAWNDLFCGQVTKPWGTFLNTDDVTNKKLSMDVARILIRTLCQKVVDEFCDVIINGDVFHIRILEDSYGPMRIAVSQTQAHEGRVVNGESSEEDEEEEEQRRLVEVDDEERESEGEGENLLVLNSHVNANNSPNLKVDQVVDSVTVREFFKENSNSPIYFDANPINENLINADNLNFNEGGDVLEDLINVREGNQLGQESIIGGPGYDFIPLNMDTGGADKIMTKSVDLGRVHKPTSQSEGDSGGVVEHKGGVYSDGPRSVYKKLNRSPFVSSSKQKHSTQNNNNKSRQHRVPIIPSSANLRKQQLLSRSLSSRNCRTN
ncbi:hypothetical protein TSUD_419600, partial [Trifolium subterraneum]